MAKAAKHPTSAPAEPAVRLYAAPAEDSNMSLYLPGNYEARVGGRRFCWRTCAACWALAGLFAFLIVSALLQL